MEMGGWAPVLDYQAAEMLEDRVRHSEGVSGVDWVAH